MFIMCLQEFHLSVGTPVSSHRPKTPIGVIASVNGCRLPAYTGCGVHPSFREVCWNEVSLTLNGQVGSIMEGWKPHTALMFNYR